jgi:hypothetical protein
VGSCFADYLPNTESSPSEPPDIRVLSFKVPFVTRYYLTTELLHSQKDGLASGWWIADSTYRVNLPAFGALLSPSRRGGGGGGA